MPFERDVGAHEVAERAWNTAPALRFESGGGHFDSLMTVAVGSNADEVEATAFVRLLYTRLSGAVVRPSNDRAYGLAFDGTNLSSNIAGRVGYSLRGLKSEQDQNGNQGDRFHGGGSVREVHPTVP